MPVKHNMRGGREGEREREREQEKKDEMEVLRMGLSEWEGTDAMTVKTWRKNLGDEY